MPCSRPAKRFRTDRDESNRPSCRRLDHLVGDWKSACDQFQAEMRAIEMSCERGLSGWDRCLRSDWRPPTSEACVSAPLEISSTPCRRHYFRKPACPTDLAAFPFRPMLVP